MRGSEGFMSLISARHHAGADPAICAAPRRHGCVEQALEWRGKARERPLWWPLAALGSVIACKWSGL